MKLIKVDGKTDISEAITLYKINEFLDININDADSSLNMDEEYCMNIIQNLEPIKKSAVKELFEQMANTDGHYDKVEVNFISNLFN
jgi:uncharacterized tellurite resistance protein B-like protein